MKLLLDTNALVWFATRPEQIGKNAQASIQKATLCYISTISVFEITMKVMNDKLRFPTNIDEVVQALSADYLSLSSSHAQAVRHFPELARHDPFDRILLAQAYDENLTLLTGDTTLLALGLDYVVDVRQ